MSDFKILIPLDGSRLAEHSLAFLPSLRQLGNLEVTLISVIDFDDDLLDVIASEEREREYNLFSAYLREVKRDLEGHLGIKVNAEPVRGSAAPRILESAEKLSPDLLIISTHGRSGLARWQQGAVADRVIRGAQCPVLVVGPRAMEQGQWLQAETVLPFKNILVPLDGSERAEQALQPAAKFADVFSSHIHLFQVMPYVPLAVSFSETPAKITENVLNSGQAYLSTIAAKLDRANVTYRTTMGPPAFEIEAYAKGNAIDLIVMSSQGRSGLARAALGSVTDRVIGAGPPVLVVRSTT